VTLKIGIDSYCFHRFFGEVYPQQVQPPYRMTLEDFLGFAHGLGVDGVSLESCFIPQRHDPGYMQSVKALLDDYGLERVYAWGHPDGLEGGRSATAYDDMIQSFENAQQIGAKVMRVVGSSLMFRNDPHQPQIDALVDMFSRAVKVAKQYDIKMAVENHIDFNADEFLQLIERVNSPYLGLNFDTGNFLRLLDDPLTGMGKLARYTYATHVKDLKVQPGVAANEWYFFSATPVGDGYVNNLQLATMLQAVNYPGFLAVEIDFLHPDYNDDEHAAVRESITELRRIAMAVGS
jgi:sugar phosphate isomerase/epimerase